MTYTNSSQAGDSGGPVYYNNGTNLFLIGLNFAKGTILNKSFGIACRISNVISELNVTPITMIVLAPLFFQMEQYNWML